MNEVRISGYVTKNGSKVVGKTTRFSINVYKGKDKDGNKQSFFMSVKVLGNITIKPSDYVEIEGWIDRYTYNDKEYTEICVMPKNVFVTRKREDEPENIPF